MGAAAGAALAGLRPVAELMFADFVGVCMDQIYNQIAKFRYMFGGKTTCPVVIRMAMGAGMNMGAQHSQSIYAFLTAVPGLKVVVPSNAYDAKGLMIQAIRDDDPVMFFEHKALYPRKAEVPEEAYTVAFGEANVLREGDDATVVAIGRMVNFAEKALDGLAAEGIKCDLIDPRTTSPLDAKAILASVENTGRLIVVDESPPRCSVAADIAAMVASRGFDSLQAPVEMVTPPHSPVPFSPALERAYVPGPQKIAEAIRRTLQLAQVSDHPGRHHAQVGHRDDRGHGQFLDRSRRPVGRRRASRCWKWRPTRSSTPWRHRSPARCGASWPSPARSTPWAA